MGLPEGEIRPEENNSIEQPQRQTRQQTAAARPLHRRSAMNTLVLLFGAIVALATGVNGQGIGVDICACSPSQFEFVFDFSLTCPPVNITTGDAVSATSCLISPFGNPEVQDLIPVSVQTIDILELGQDLRVLVQENIAGNFGDGDSFQYTSIAAIPAEINSSVDIPRAIQLNIVGVNRLDEPIINVYIITYTNNCGAYPVLQEGQSAGWTVMGQLDPPLKEFCPASPGVAVTEAPVATGAPVAAITPAPVTATTTAPLPAPTLNPTTAPIEPEATKSPTRTPSAEPTKAPAIISPVMPVPIPTPTPPTTRAPVSFSMSMDFGGSIDEMLESEFGRDTDMREGKTPKRKDDRYGKKQKMTKKDKRGDEKQSKKYKMGKKRNGDGSYDSDDGEPIDVEESGDYSDNGKKGKRRRL